jgi:drug/metabolite transporter (DMT)-like permease
VAPPSAWKLALLASMGLTGGLGHYFIARAYYAASASVVSPFNYLQLVGAALMDYLVFRDPPGLAVWLGAGLIAGSGLWLVYSERR